MAYEEFSNKPSVSSGDALDPTVQINNPAQGVQDELEIRQGDFPDGVVSGMVCTIDSGNDEIDIASGRAYVAGKRYSGGASVAFAAQSTDTYFIYIDSTDDTTPYKAKTTAPTSGEITLCTVLWTLGTTTLSALDDDLKKLGLIPYDISFRFSGTLSLTDFRIEPVLHDMWIQNVQIICGDNGSSSASVVADVHLNGTTIFTTQGNRPSLSHDVANKTIATSGKPDGDRKPDTGEYLEAIIDSIDGAGTAADGAVVIKGYIR